MIYLDNAATTRMCREAEEAMLPYFREQYGNPSAMYGPGRKAREVLRTARETISGMLHVKPDEIYFTSGGTESDNWALTSVFEACRAKGNHIITSRVEHPAVLRTCEYLERERGARITMLKTDRYGMIDPEEAEAAIRPDTILLSVMFANNEVGTLQPVQALGKIAHAHGVLFHTDAVQAFGHVPIDADALEIDLLSASGHKFYGPKGTGFLYVKKGIGIGSMIRGGAQEYNRRAGTENVPGIAGMEAAARAAAARMRSGSARDEAALRDYMIRRLTEEITGTTLNGHREQRLSNNINCCFTGVSAEAALIMLDLQEICASAGSACASGSIDPSHVLMAMGCTREAAFSSLRFTLSHETTKEEIDTVIDAMKRICGQVRQGIGKRESDA